MEFESALKLAVARRHLVKAGFVAAGAGLWPDAPFPLLVRAEEEDAEAPADAATIGQREIVKGLDGMSRVADKGNKPFSGGHNAAAVIASAFFCREQNLADETRKGMLSLIEDRLLTSRIYVPRPEEPADPELVAGLVEDLDTGIAKLRKSGHNIIFAVICLKALQATPEAATPGRIEGLRKMVRSFGTDDRGAPAEAGEGFVDLSDESQFIHFIFEQYLDVLDLYLNGKGHHGYAGHLLTVGHALIELGRMGHPEIARKGIGAYWDFVREARKGASRGGKKVAAGPPQSPTPLDPDYWVEQGERRRREITSSHLIKYPYSFYALAKEVKDDDLKQRIFESLFHLSAVS